MAVLVDVVDADDVVVMVLEVVAKVADVVVRTLGFVETGNDV